jgi:hypothetical protein
LSIQTRTRNSLGGRNGQSSKDPSQPSQDQEPKLVGSNEWIDQTQYPKPNKSNDKHKLCSEDIGKSTREKEEGGKAERVGNDYPCDLGCFEFDIFRDLGDGDSYSGYITDIDECCLEISIR